MNRYRAIRLVLVFLAAAVIFEFLATAVIGASATRESGDVQFFHSFPMHMPTDNEAAMSKNA